VASHLIRFVVSIVRKNGWTAATVMAVYMCGSEGMQFN
jgi:hypothetical protein